MDSQEKQSPISAISQIGLVRSWNWIIGLLPTTAPGFFINAVSDRSSNEARQIEVTTSYNR